MNTGVTFVTVIKDRDREPTERFLESINNQTYPCNIIIVDFGSNEKNLRCYGDLFDKYNVNFYIARNNLEPFRESRGLNIGIKQVDTEYTILTNVDLIFPKDLVEMTVHTLENDDKAVVLCQRLDISETGQMEPHAKTAYGTFFAVRTDWLRKVRGVDEAFFLWGAWDMDLMERAKKDGLHEVWISDRYDSLMIRHMWHEPAQKAPNLQNERYRSIPDKPVIRNKNSWGEL